jgi:hypothetical protein
MPPKTQWLGRLLNGSSSLLGFGLPRVPFGAGGSPEDSSLHRGHDGHVNTLTAIIYFPPSVHIIKPPRKHDMRASTLILVVKHDYAITPIKDELRAFHICHVYTVDGLKGVPTSRLSIQSTEPHSFLLAIVFCSGLTLWC